mgnify:CR=1 FL=1
MPPTDISENVFTVSRDIRFSESDPAGIVFYAEFFRMFNDLFEDWLVKCLGIDFADQFQNEQRMFPLVHVEVDFKAPRHMGQKMDLSLLLTSVGRSSICYDIIGHDGDLEILRGSFVTCVASKIAMSTIELPPEFRRLMVGYMDACKT